LQVESERRQTQTKEPPQFGIDGLSPKAVEIVKELCVPQDLNGLKWSDLEPRKREYKFTAARKQFEVLGVNNIQVNINTNSDWAMEYGNTICNGPPETCKERVRIKPEHMEDWKNFIRKFVNEFRK